MSSVFELVAGLVIATVAVFFVLRPILSPPVAGAASQADLEGEDPEDDLSPRSVALRALKEIEFDRATGKLSDADYDALKARYTAEALAALRSEPPASPAIASRETAAPRARAAAAPRGAATCPTHGARPEANATFCSECGRRLSEAAAFCRKCGTALEADARFCAACGRRVAA